METFQGFRACFEIPMNKKEITTTGKGGAQTSIMLLRIISLNSHLSESSQGSLTHYPANIVDCATINVFPLPNLASKGGVAGAALINPIALSTETHTNQHPSSIVFTHSPSTNT